MRISRLFLVLALLSVLSVLALAQERKNPRNFPEGTTCPIHLGWEVDLVNGQGVPDPSSTPRVHEGLTFVAEGPRAAVTFLACDRNSALIDGLSDFDAIGETVEVRIDDVAVVREDIFLSHQRAAVRRRNSDATSTSSIRFRRSPSVRLSTEPSHPRNVRSRSPYRSWTIFPTGAKPRAAGASRERSWTRQRATWSWRVSSDPWWVRSAAPRRASK